MVSVGQGQWAHICLGLFSTGLFTACVGGTETPATEQVESDELLRLPQYDATGCLGPGCRDGLQDGEFDYIIVGSGAGGGPLAANLARRGHRVLLLEAGEDPGGRQTHEIPAWHALASEDDEISWDFFVKHYADEAQAVRDDKMVYGPDGQPKGILYPRGSAVGGSTAVNALITVYPHNSDWNHIASVMQDEDPEGTWSASNMRNYFVRAENNGYLPRGAEGHGYDGWMRTEVHPGNLLDFLMAIFDTQILKIIGAGIIETVSELSDGDFDPIRDAGRLLSYLTGDINAGEPERDGREGVFRVPQLSEGKRRAGTRPFILDTIEAGYPLTLKIRAYVTNVVFDRSGPVPRAVGVDWQNGQYLYEASPKSDLSQAGEAQSIRVNREVILSAGAYNTPQLLMLSGVGPQQELARHGIETLVNLPGVGQNMQDRYEVGIVGEVDRDFVISRRCPFDASKNATELFFSDPCYVEWQFGAGVYTFNGAVVSVIKRSSPDLVDPDLFIFGAPGYFVGYWPGYAANVTAEKKYFTWLVLKGHTKNTAGTVTLKSADPRESPEIQFNYFDESTDAQADLDAMVEGVVHSRKMMDRAKGFFEATGEGFREVYPGPEVETREDIAQFVKDRAWGHHTCCTAKIGRADDEQAVLDARFRVRGTEGLRVVDASVFPKIPGFFIAVPIYMVSEKAADVIHEDALR